MPFTGQVLTNVATAETCKHQVSAHTDMNENTLIKKHEYLHSIYRVSKWEKWEVVCLIKKMQKKYFLVRKTKGRRHIYVLLPTCWQILKKGTITRSICGIKSIQSIVETHWHSAPTVWGSMNSNALSKYSLTIITDWGSMNNNALGKYSLTIILWQSYSAYSVNFWIHKKVCRIKMSVKVRSLFEKV